MKVQPLSVSYRRNCVRTMNQPAIHSLPEMAESTDAGAGTYFFLAREG
mgnify:CR=1 FL=1